MGFMSAMRNHFKDTGRAADLSDRNSDRMLKLEKKTGKGLHADHIAKAERIKDPAAFDRYFHQHAKSLRKTAAWERDKKKSAAYGTAAAGALGGAGLAHRALGKRLDKGIEAVETAKDLSANVKGPEAKLYGKQLFREARGHLRGASKLRGARALGVGAATLLGLKALTAKKRKER